jgi:hypothetical protein
MFKRVSQIIESRKSRAAAYAIPASEKKCIFRSRLWRLTRENSIINFGRCFRS